ncbi:MAG: RNA-binding S4 domain-containing protein [Erysipelotrichia bacterium]|nr:RNA-binding S4 domain-containing protein [Erysipelotrichia bacterium]
MRLDLVLKLSGLVKRRTVAKALAERGFVLINDRVAKPASEVKEYDILELRLGNRVLLVEITFIQKFKKDFPVYTQILPKRDGSDA